MREGRKRERGMGGEKRAEGEREKDKIEVTKRRTREMGEVVNEAKRVKGGERLN